MLLAGHWINFAPVLMMLVILTLNYAFTRYRGDRRDAQDEARLRVALISELRALQEVYRMNLRMIQREAGYLLSTRAPAVIYKSNQGRLTSLIEESVLEKVVSLYARNEIIESLLSANATGNGGLSFKLRPDSKLDELKKMYMAGIHQIIRTCAALGAETLDAETSNVPPSNTRPRATGAIVPAPINQQLASA